MKLFSKKQKNKKPLTDKAKQEKKDKTKRIIKRVLDVLVYGFAIFMIFGLLLGSCNQKTKSASAYYHSEGGYTSITQVEATLDSSSVLHYYYDYNYKKTFPSFANFFDALPPSSSSQYVYGRVRLSNPIAIDNYSYTWLNYISIFPSQSDFREYRLLVTNDGGTAPAIQFVTITLNDIVINRSDILTSIFNGRNSVFLSTDDNHTITDNDIRFYKFLVYYFGTLGYNRINYTFPINVSRLAYLFVNSDNTDNLIENGYFFKNDTFPSVVDNIGLSVFEPIFLGSFRCNGVYYSSIVVKFSSVFGNMAYGDSYYGVKYHMPGMTGADDYLPSWDEFYRGYWYIDKIYFQNDDISQEVWSAFNITMTPGSYASYNYYDLNFRDTWVGDSAYSSTPYRDLFIYYVDDSFSGVTHNPFTDYPQLYGMTFADFINFIGEAYPTHSTGAPTDTTSPLTNVFEWLRIALSGCMPLFGYTILPGITIGTLIMVPITMSIILFVVGLFKR